ncbi:ArsI/CadI family heavy metal resistance metalloenzyme [Lysobacter silvisoli]|uniref:Glyoxalase/bleomycin resistance/dioxygenase family protein n=1 Tax=Lysobacter silvisoli TaxID=2293254 RepID=A0A371K4Y8_9GAMM|nr:ArsI/CadI family heavy metal resistance metalloenzyme [Lysobacter silvisoli]RDZ28942.1 glyoxalase/bleomycin resistance/dioxygenase family protein [Lysobacter silvisoli]
MNRFHVHLNVARLDDSLRFYTRLFAREPAVVKADYAKWMLDDPRLNFAISATGRAPGVDHLGLQVDSGEELAALGQRLDAAGQTVAPEPDATCCYARSDKLWTQDPQGTRWESFHTFGDAVTYYAGDQACADHSAACAAPAPAAVASTGACCAPSTRCA